MTQGDFWLQSNNGKKYQLGDFRNFRAFDAAKNPKIQKIIKFFDLDNSGELEVNNKNGVNEYDSIFKTLMSISGDDVLTDEEFNNYINEKQKDIAPEERVTQEDLNEFLDFASKSYIKKFDNCDVLYKDGLISQVKKKNDKGEVETFYYERKVSEGKELYEISKNDPFGITTWVVDNIDEQGNYSENNLISKTTYLSKRQPEIILYEEGKIKELGHLDGNIYLKEKEFSYSDNQVIQTTTTEDGYERTIAESIKDDGTLVNVTERHTRNFDGTGRVDRKTGDGKFLTIVLKKMDENYEYSNSDIEKEFISSTPNESDTSDIDGGVQNALSQIYSFMHELEENNSIRLLNYDKNILKNFFETLGTENSQYAKVGDNPPEYAVKDTDEEGLNTMGQRIFATNSTDILQSSSIRSVKDKKYYNIVLSDKDSDVSKTYCFSSDGEFLFATTVNHTKPNIKIRTYPNGFKEEIYSENGLARQSNIYNKKGECIRTKSYLWENNRIAATDTIYTDKNNGDKKDIRVVALGTGEEYYYKPDSAGKYTVLDSARICDSIPILNENNEITGYNPISAMILNSDNTANHSGTYKRADFNNNLMSGETYDFSAFDNNLRNTAADVLIQTYDNTINILKDELENSGRSIIDGSAWLDILRGLFDEQTYQTITEEWEKNNGINAPKEVLNTIIGGVLKNAVKKLEEQKALALRLKESAYIVEEVKDENGDVQRYLYRSDKYNPNDKNYQKDRLKDENGNVITGDAVNEFLKANYERNELDFASKYSKLTGHNWDVEEHQKFTRYNLQLKQLQYNLQAVYDNYKANNGVLDEKFQNMFVNISGEKTFNQQSLDAFIKQAEAQKDENGEPYVIVMNTNVAYAKQLNYSDSLLKKTKTSEITQGILNDRELAGQAGGILDIFSMIAGFKASSWILGKAGKLLKWGGNLVKTERMAEYAANAGKWMESTGFWARTANLTKNALSRMTIGGANFGLYDTAHETGRQIYAGESINAGKIGHKGLLGFGTGAGAGFLSMAISEPIIRKFYKPELLDCAVEVGKSADKTGKNIARIISQTKSMPTLATNPLLKTAAFGLEVFTFSIASGGIQLLDGEELRHSLKQARSGIPALQDLTDEQIDKMSKTEIMRSMLEMQGFDTKELSDSEVGALYGGNEYVNQFKGLLQFKFSESIIQNTIGMYLTKGKKPTGKFGPRVSAMNFEPAENGFYKLAGDKSRRTYTDLDMTYMVERAMALDAIDSRMQNKYNNYQNKKIPASDFAKMVNLNIPPELIEGMTVVPKGEKYELTTSDGKTQEVDIEGFINVCEQKFNDYIIEQQKAEIEKIIEKYLTQQKVPDEQKDIFAGILRRNFYTQFGIEEKGVNEGDKSPRPTTTADKKGVKNVIAKVNDYLGHEKTLEGGIKDTELTEVAPFVKTDEKVEELKMGRVITQDAHSMPIKYNAAKNEKDLYKQLKKLSGEKISESEFNKLLKDIELSEENLDSLSKMIAIIEHYNGEQGVLKNIIEYTEREEKSLSDVVSLIENIVLYSKNSEKLLKKDSFNLSHILSFVKHDTDIQDFNNLLLTYVQYYNKNNNSSIERLFYIKPKVIERAIELMNKYASDPELKDAVDPTRVGADFDCLVFAKDDNLIAQRIKQLKQLINFKGDNQGRYGSTKRSILKEENEELFNTYVNRLKTIKENLEVDKPFDSKQIVHIYERILSLDDTQFENISKRNLWDKLYKFEINDFTELTDEEFARFESRKLEVKSENVWIVKLTDNEYEKYISRKINETSKNFNAKFLAECSDEQWSLIEKYNLKNGNIHAVKYMLSKGEAYIQKLEERNLLDDAQCVYNDFEIIDKFVEMSDEEYSVVQKRNLTEFFENRKIKRGDKIYTIGFKLKEIDILRQVSDKDWPRVQYLLTVSRGYIDPYKCHQWGDTKFEDMVEPFDLEQVFELSELADEDFEFLKNSGALNELSMDGVRAFLDFKNFAHIKDAKDLTTADNRRLSTILVKHNQALFDEVFHDFIAKEYGESVIPKNQQEYCDLLSRSVRESVIQVNPIPEEQQIRFKTSLSDMGKKDSVFLKTNLEDKDFRLDLEYPREQFMQDVMSALDGLSNSEKQRIMDYYGFEVYKKDGKPVMSGYPMVLKSMPELTTEQGKKVQKLVERYSNSKISVKNNPELSKMLNDIFDTMPELKGIIGKVQHGTHDYTVDVHTLKVLQGVMSNQKFETLSESDKKILTISTLMHDISKKELDIDKQHPQNSATESYQLLAKIDLTPEERENIYHIVKNHDWLEKYNQEGITSEERTKIAQQIAYALKDGNNFELASILAEADLKGVQRGGYFYKQYESVLKNGIAEISALVKQVKATEIYLPITKLPKASELIVDGEIVEERIIKGHKVKILHLNSGQDLSKVGFPPGTMSDDLQLLYHGFAHEEYGTESEGPGEYNASTRLERVKSFEDVNSDAVLSHSILSTYGPEVYATFGAINYVPSSHIIAGAESNIGSGYNTDKNIPNMAERFIFGEGKKYGRDYFPNKLKEKLGLNDEEYINLYTQISGMTMTELKQKMPQVAKVMDEILYETEEERQNAVSTGFNGQKITEIIAHHIVNQGYASPYGIERLDNMPEVMLADAENNDKLIVVNGKKSRNGLEVKLPSSTTLPVEKGVGVNDKTNSSLASDKGGSEPAREGVKKSNESLHPTTPAGEKGVNTGSDSTHSATPLHEKETIEEPTPVEETAVQEVTTLSVSVFEARKAEIQNLISNNPKFKDEHKNLINELINDPEKGEVYAEIISNLIKNSVGLDDYQGMNINRILEVAACFKGNTAQVELDLLSDISKNQKLTEILLKSTVGNDSVFKYRDTAVLMNTLVHSPYVEYFDSDGIVEAIKRHYKAEQDSYERKHLDDWSPVNAINDILFKVSKSEHVGKNEALMKKLPEMLSKFALFKYAKYNTQNILYILEERPRLLENTPFIENIEQLLFIKDSKDIAGLQYIPNEILSNPELMKSHDFIRNMCSLGKLFKDKTAQAKNIINMITSNPDFYDNYNILSGVAKSLNEKVKLNYAEKILSLNNESINRNCEKWIPTDDEHRKILDLYLSKPEYAKNPQISNKIGSLENLKQLQNIITFFNNKFADGNIPEVPAVKILKENPVLKGNKELSNVLSVFEQKMAMVEDTQVLEYVNSRLNELAKNQNLTEKDLTELYELDNIPDVVNEYNGFYSSLLKHNESETADENYTSHRDEGVKKHLSESTGRSFFHDGKKSRMSEEYQERYKKDYYIDRIYKKMPKESVIAYLGVDETQYELMTEAQRKEAVERQNYINHQLNQAENVDRRAIKDSSFATENRIGTMREYLINYPNSKLADHFYKDYYIKLLEEHNIPESVINKCKQFEKKYGIKMLIPMNLKSKDLINLCDATETLLEVFRIASNGNAYFPPLLDYRSIGEWAKAAGLAGDTQVGINTKDNHNFKLEDAMDTLRHELIHFNDELKKGKKIPDMSKVYEVMPRIKDENGKTIDIDYDNCKYMDILREAGIEEYHVKYAYENVFEFKAVAMTGNVEVYNKSEYAEFKQFLIDIGTPEWMFNLGKAREIVESKADSGTVESLDGIKINLDATKPEDYIGDTNEGLGFSVKKPDQGKQTGNSEVHMSPANQAGQNAESAAKVDSLQVIVENKQVIKGKNGFICLTDSNGERLGYVNYALSGGKDNGILTFEGLETDVQGQDVGTKLILELINTSKRLGAKGRLFATASPMKGSDGKVRSNLGFYYKLGFKAVDPNIDAQIRACIEKGEEIPLGLNAFTPIELSKSAAQDIERTARLEILDKFEKVESEKGQALDKAIFEFSQMIKNKQDVSAKLSEIKAGIQELRETNPQEAENLSIVLNTLMSEKSGAEATREEIGAVVQHMRRQYDSDIERMYEELCAISGSLPLPSYRLKSDTSMFDKIANYALEHPERPLTEAYESVRDTGGFRFNLPSADMKNDPEVLALIKAGKPEEAFELGLKKKSGPVMDFINKLLENDSYFKIARVSDYHDNNNHAIIDEQTLKATEFTNKAQGKDGIIVADVKVQYKAQQSCYPALQINLRTPDGKIIELQIRFDEVHEYAEFEHLVYDIMSNKDIIGRHPELEPLLQPLSDVLDSMTEEQYEEYYIPYTRAQFNYRFMKALGIETKEPRLEEFPGPDGKPLSPLLDAKNLKKLHDLMDEVKDKKNPKPVEQACKEYNRFVENKPEREQQTSDSGIAYSSFIPLPSQRLVKNLGYEFSRTVNRGKRAVTYVSGKIQKAGQNTKKAAKCVPMLTSATLMNLKLKRFGIKDSINRWNIVEKLYNSNFESKNVRKQIINSIKTLKKMQVRDWEIANMLFQLEKIENGERILDKTSLEIISEMEKLYQKTSSDWNEFTFCKLTLDSIEDGNNVEVLNKIKDLNLAVDRGYTLEDAEQNMRMGIRGEKNINLYEDILKSPVTASLVGGLGIEYTSREIFNTCKNSQKEVVSENWELLQQFSKELLEFAPYSRPFKIFKTLKNDDIEITKQNLKIFLDAYKTDPRSVKISRLDGCITKEGRLDLSMMGDAEIAGKLGVDSKDLKNPDGTYNQNAIKYIQALKDAGFNDNISFNNIIDLARSAAAKQKLEGEIYSKEIIDTAIELKEYGIKDDVVSHIIKLATRKGIVDKELLELYKPFGMVLKTEDLYTLEQGIGDMLTYGNSEYRPQIVSQMIHLLKNGLSLHEIAMSNVFTHEGADGNIVTADVLKGLVQLKQNDFYAGNLQEVLDSCRKPDGSINQEILNTFVELKKQGFDEFYLKHIINTATNSKGELNKDNLNLMLQLMKEFKGSEFCRDKDEVYMAQLLMEICTDKSGQVNQKLLEETKKSLPELFKMIDEEDKISFRYILDRALTPDGKFDKRIIEKINELKTLDDNIHDPNYIQTAGRFIEACKDSEGNFSLEKYNDGVMLVKKYGFTKHEVSYKLAPYEDFKSYKNKNNIYDLSLQEKRQLQSLLLRYNSNISTLQDLKKMLKSDLLPTTDSEYAKIMKQLSQSLGQTDFVLNNIELNQMNTEVSRLSKTLAANESVGEVKISTTYDELLKQIQSKMSGLSESEKLKIYDYFGFTVKDGKIIGFPSANGKSIENSDITNSFSKKVVEALTKLVNDYNKNTQITVEGNPELSRILTSLSQTMPEILNKFSNPIIAKQTIQTIQKISKTEDFVKLNEQDKNILIVAALLKDTNIGSLRESAYHMHTMSAKFSWNKTDREKLYNLLIVPERIEECNNSNPDKVITRYIRSTTIKSNEREEAIDMFAFTIKDRNLDKMSYLLYADKISPELKTELEKRIYEIKKDDFILPQLSMDNLDKYVVEEEHNGHKVKVVHASRVPDLFAFVHTPEAGIINYASRTTKLSNFEEFSNIDNDAVICASYVSSSHFGAFRKHGLVFKVPTGHEYVGMSYDMTSLGKNTREMVAEYYRNKGLKAGQGKGMKYAHRTFVSMKLKDTLHITEHSYSELLKSRHELLAQLKEIKDKSNSEYQNIRTQIVKINKEIKKIDDDYVARMDKVKEQCTSEQVSLSDIKEVDPTLAKAFEEFLSKTNRDYNTDALMRKDFWNEVLVNEMTVVGGYTVEIDKMPEEYLIESETSKDFYIIDFSR